MVPTPCGDVQSAPRRTVFRDRVSISALVAGSGLGDAAVPVPMRLNITLAVKRLVRDVAARLPELAHVRPSRLLVVAGEARRASRATIRPARPVRGRTGPTVRVKGRRILYVVTLRPLWFLDSTPEERIGTILHELYHASKRFDGSLHGGRRHSRLPLPLYNRKVHTLLLRYLAVAPEEIVAPFAHDGIVRARMWLERPTGGVDPESARRRVYTERQLFNGLVRMRTRHGPRRRR
jgi:predicted metallopeptidase